MLGEGDRYLEAEAAQDGLCGAAIGDRGLVVSSRASGAAPVAVRHMVD
jgi:hypothetical protein